MQRESAPGIVAYRCIAATERVSPDSRLYNGDLTPPPSPSLSSPGRVLKSNFLEMDFRRGGVYTYIATYVATIVGDRVGNGANIYRDGGMAIKFG